jgi:hypothetical protein
MKELRNYRVLLISLCFAKTDNKILSLAIWCIWDQVLLSLSTPDSLLLTLNYHKPVFLTIVSPSLKGKSTTSTPGSTANF